MRPNCKLLIEKIRNNLLLFSIFISLVIGFSIGSILKKYDVDSAITVWFKLPGLLFIRCLELLILPVIFIGVVAATSTLSAKNNVRITLICVFFIFVTHLIAVITGHIGSLILKAVSISQTDTFKTDSSFSNHIQKNAYDIVSDILRNIIPKNIIKSATHQEITKLIKDSNGTLVKKSVQYIDGTNLLGILFFAVLIGLATSVLDTKVTIFRQFFQSANEVVIYCLSWIIIFSPIGIASLIIEAILEVENVEESFKKIGIFAAVCSATLIFYGLVVLSLLVFIFTRHNPFKYYLHFIEPALLAAASTSGAVCMFKSLEVCEQTLKMDKRISRFAISFYTALQADGSAIFIVMATNFLATYTNSSLSTTDYVVILIETGILCICLPSVPSSSIVTILVVLNTINISNLNIALLYTVEWLLDRLRTTVNLYSHDFCTVITNDLFQRYNQDAFDDDVELNTINESILTLNKQEIFNF